MTRIDLPARSRLNRVRLVMSESTTKYKPTSSFNNHQLTDCCKYCSSAINVYTNCCCSFNFFFFFQSVLRWSVAVSIICRHSSRVVAFLHAVTRPKFRGPRSASIARSQVWLGLPAGRFQSGSTYRIHVARARWSSRGELRAIWPKSRRRLLVTRWERWTTSGSDDFCIWFILQLYNQLLSISLFTKYNIVKTSEDNLILTKTFCQLFCYFHSFIFSVTFIFLSFTSLAEYHANWLQCIYKTRRSTEKCIVSYSNKSVRPKWPIW